MAGKVVIRPGADADVQARMLDGRTATIERIFTDYDGKTHLGVTIDDDPGQDLMRDTGRLDRRFRRGPDGRQWRIR